jgi:peptidoglycan/LPS O-acetylase OafA/YrhL
MAIRHSRITSSKPTVSRQVLPVKVRVLPAQCFGASDLRTPLVLTPRTAQAGKRDASHIDILDAVRGLAALSVAYLHCREIIWIGMRAYLRAHGFDLSFGSIVAYATFPVIWGSIGVPILFVVSGYVIHRRAARSIGPESPHFDVLNFLIRRFVRIYPTLILAIIFTYLCDTITTHYIQSHNRLGDKGVSTTLFNLAAMQGIFAKPYGSNGSLWSLSVEIQFYIVYPLALVLWRRIGPTGMLVFSILISAAGYLCLQQNEIIAFPQYYFSWWLGAYVADCEARYKFRSQKLLIGCGGVFIIIGCLVYLLKFDFAAFMAWAIGAAFLIGVLTLNNNKTHKYMNNFILKFMSHIGKFSYSLYVFHLPTAMLISAVVFRGAGQDSIFYSFGALIVLIIVAQLLYFVAEKPSIQLLERMRR